MEPSSRGAARTPTEVAHTRALVARALLEHGPSTATIVAERLEITPAAVRRHLDSLVADGLATSAERAPWGPVTKRVGPGRPARYFVLTSAGRDEFEQAYDDLAAGALRYLADRHGAAAVMEFARERVAPIEARYAAELADVAPAERTHALAQALSGDGYAAEARPAPEPSAGEQICQHHCPVAHVAAEFPQLCEAESEMFGRLLNTHVSRLATIAHGDGICTTHVPVRSGSTTHAPAPGRQLS